MKESVKNILLLAISLLFILFLIEGTVRILGIGESYGFPEGTFQSDSVLGYKLAPDFEGVFIKQEFKTFFKTNSLGMFDKEYGPKQEDDFRILALGDSFTWGAYDVTLNQTFVKIAEQELNKNADKVTFHIANTGVPGYGTDQELLVLQQLTPVLKPDVVLVNFYVNNDFIDNENTGELIVNKKGQLVTKTNSETTPEKIRGGLLKYSHAYRVAERGLLNVIGNIVGDKFLGKVTNWSKKKHLYNKQDPLFEAQAAKTQDILSALHKFTEEHNQELVIILIPAKYQVDSNLQKVFMEDNGLTNEEVSMTKPQTRIKEWAETVNVKVIDLLPYLASKNSDNDFYWTLNPHFNPKGQKEVGQIIAYELSSEKYIKEKLRDSISYNDKEQRIRCRNVEFPPRSKSLVVSSDHNCITSS